jgi:hypothetical protein
MCLTIIEHTLRDSMVSLNSVSFAVNGLLVMEIRRFIAKVILTNKVYLFAVILSLSAALLLVLGIALSVLGIQTSHHYNGMKYFKNLISWKRHLSKCIPGYVANISTNTSVLCPHPLCPIILPSEQVL